MTATNEIDVSQWSYTAILIINTNYENSQKSNSVLENQVTIGSNNWNTGVFSAWSNHPKNHPVTNDDES